MSAPAPAERAYAPLFVYASHCPAQSTAHDWFCQQMPAIDQGRELEQAAPLRSKPMAHLDLRVTTAIICDPDGNKIMIHKRNH